MKMKYLLLLIPVLFFSCSPDQTATKETNTLSKPAPGIVSVTAEVVNVDKNESKTTLKILDLISGGNTPSLSKGNSIILYFPDRGTIYDRFNSALTSNENISVRIKAATILGENNHQWQFLEFINNKR